MTRGALRRLRGRRVTTVEAASLSGGAVGQVFDTDSVAPTALDPFLTPNLGLRYAALLGFARRGDPIGLASEETLHGCRGCAHLSPITFLLCVAAFLSEQLVEFLSARRLVHLRFVVSSYPCPFASIRGSALLLCPFA